MGTELIRIRVKAGTDRKCEFTGLMHHVYDVDNLRSTYEKLDGKKAIGIDGVDKKIYGENLEVNLEELSKKLRTGGYRSQPKRRTYIPKLGSNKKRALAISSFEDKIVESMMKSVMEQIYEVDFEASSYDIDPGRPNTIA